ncbi:hypothetical protein [Paraburkholderia tropica]|nr:hypothetical protein [Paraburkholderia tropica]
MVDRVRERAARGAAGRIAFILAILQPALRYAVLYGTFAENLSA